MSGGKRVLCLGGGGYRGAFQVPILERLMSQGTYDIVLGISIGAANGACACVGALATLREAWESVDARAAPFGAAGFAALSRKPTAGLISLDPMRDRMQDLVTLQRLTVPLGCGVVVRETYEYRLLLSGDMSSDTELHDAIVGSSAIAGLMPPVVVHDGGHDLTLSDGGHRHNVPLPPVEWQVAEIDAVFCTALEREASQDVRSLRGSIVWAIENQLELAKQQDLEGLAARAAQGTRVRVFAPAEPTGGMLQADGARISRRLELGEQALSEPLLL